MPPSSEARLKARIRDDLTGRGIWWTNIPNGVVGSIPGDPDMLMCHDGHMIAIEGKSPSGAKRGLQKDRQALIEKCGGSYHVVRNWEQYLMMLKKEGIE